MIKIAKLFKKYLPLFLIYTLIIILIVYAKQVSVGVNNGIETCITLVIPSLFIFMVLSSVIINSKLADIIALPFKSIAKLFFNIDASLFSVVLLSLVGGYPVGAKLIASKLRQGEITIDNANNMLCYCVNCGPAFLISGVGIAILGSFTIGLALYLSQVIACICVGLMLRSKGIRSIPKAKTRISGATLVVNSVTESVRSMGIVCGFIIAFSSAMPLLSNVFGKWYVYLNGILEVTTSCKAVASITNGVVLIAMFTAFGGLCVHMQISAMLYKTGVSLKRFYFYRIIYTAISGLLVWIYIAIVPLPQDCISISDVPSQLNTASPMATIFLILLSIILLFFSKKFDRIGT